MIRLKLGYLFFAIMLCGALIPAHGDTLFTDGTFSSADYSATTFTSGGATFTVDTCATCGNPASALQMTLNFPGVSAFALAEVNNGFAYNPLTQGAITSINASVDKDLTNTSTGGNTFHPLIEQDGVFYIASIAGTGITDINGGTTGFLTLAQSGLTASSFVEYDFTTNTSGAANDNPNFDGDGMLFGLAQISGSNGTATLNIVYDNLSLDIVNGQTPPSVPEPSSLLLLSVGLAGLIFISSRKLASNN